jgi:hypothetical protein
MEAWVCSLQARPAPRWSKSIPPWAWRQREAAKSIPPWAWRQREAAKSIPPWAWRLADRSARDPRGLCQPRGVLICEDSAPRLPDLEGQDPTILRLQEVVAESTRPGDALVLEYCDALTSVATEMYEPRRLADEPRPTA